MHPIHAPFPSTRLRRTRATPALRALVRENSLSAGDLIWPIFVRKGEGIEEAIPSMPGVMRRSVDKVADAARMAADLGIGAICVFPYTGPKTGPRIVPAHGTQATPRTAPSPRSAKRCPTWQS